MAWGQKGWGAQGGNPSPSLGQIARSGWEWSLWHAHLTEGDLAVAGAVLGVPDKHLPVVLDPALPTQNVVDAGGHLVPLKVVPEPEQDRA